MVTKREDATEGKQREPSAAAVSAYLRDHPDFLVRHPELLECLTPPARFTGSGVVDFQRHLIERLRDQSGQFDQRQQDLVALSRDNLSSQSQIHTAVLALLEARTLEHLVQVVTIDFTSILDIDVATLCVEGDVEAVAPVKTAGVFRLPNGAIDRVLGGNRDVLLRRNIEGEETFYGGAAPLVKSDALLRLQVRRGGPTGMLALGSRRAPRFHPAQGTELLGFLARVVEHGLKSWLGAPT